MQFLEVGPTMTLLPIQLFLFSTLELVCGRRWINWTYHIWVSESNTRKNERDFG